MKRLVKSILLVGSAASVNMLVSLVRNKILAVILGPSGVGFLAQLVGMQNLASGLVPMGMQIGVVRYVAKYRAEDESKLPGLVSTASKLFLMLSVITTAVCLVAIRPLSAWVLDNSRYFWYLIPTTVGMVFLVQYRLRLTFLQASLELKSYSKVLVISSVLGLFLLVPITLIWGLPGVAVHLLVFPILSYLVARRFSEPVMNKEVVSKPELWQLDHSVVRNLFRFGIANLPISGLLLLVPFLVRIQIVNDLGFAANGIYQVVFALSSQYLIVPADAMTTYSLPKLSGLSDVKLINLEVNNATRAVVLFSTAVILCVLIGRDVVIRLLFSASFISAVALLPIQMIGDVFRSIGYALNLPTLSQERLVARVVICALQYGVFLTVFFGMPSHLRLQAAVAAHAVSWFVLAVVMYIYIRRLNGFQFRADVLRLIFTSLAAVCIVGFLPVGDLRLRFLGVIVIAVWAVTAISRQEISQLRAIVARHLSGAKE